MTPQAGSPQNRSARVRDWLTQRALPHWSSAGLDADGGFAERLTLAGQADHAPKRTMVQMRQIYVYAHAAMLGLFPAGLPLARAVFGDVISRAALPGGGFAYSLAPDGGIADPTRDTYAHAFLLHGASWLYRASGDKDVLQHVENIADAIEMLRHPGGLGYAESDQPGLLRRQNPHMHLLRAFLAAHEATGENVYRVRAEEILGLFRQCFFDPATGTLREYFTQDLARAPGRQGDVVEGGHHYEWVWSLGEFARATGTALLPQARILHRFADTHCHEKITGLIYHENFADGRAHTLSKRAWPLTEAIKAAITLAEEDGAPLDPRADQAIDNLFCYFLDRPCPGAWLDTLTTDNQPAVMTSAASNFYHVFRAFAEYIRFSEKTGA